MMKIVILDGYTLNPGDLSWDGLHAFGDLRVFCRTKPEKLVERANGAEIVFTNKTPLGRDELIRLPGLKYIGVLATGYNIVDTKAARELGVVVTNVPSYGTSSVAQHSFALLLELCHHVQRHSDPVMDGKWSRSADFCYWDHPLVELAGKTMGIIGFGSIGRKVAEIAVAMGMKILAADSRHTHPMTGADFGWAEIPELLEKSDVVSIHCPLTPETEGLINRDNLRTMKKSAFLINTSRGPVIIDQDLANALNEGIIAGAGLDVLSVEPPPADNPLFHAKNCLITPHIAWATKEARSRLMDITLENLEAFLSGAPKNVVNGEG